MTTVGVDGGSIEECTTQIDGRFDERFAPVREECERNFTERDDVGASFAATVEGQYVVDIWGGLCDGARTEPWQEDTIVNVWSTTKTMTAPSALLLADRRSCSTPTTEAASPTS